MSKFDTSNSVKSKFTVGLILVGVAAFAIAAFPGFSKVHADSPVQTAAPLTTFVGTNVGPIPDNDCSGPGRQISFAVTGITSPISNVRVGFTGTHSYVGDLDARLIAPNGTTSAILFSFVGSDVNPNFGDSSDLNGTYSFFDTATASFPAAAAAVGPTTAVPPGNYRASDANGANSSLDPVFVNATPANGTYILKFNDCSQGDTGTITDATLSINGVTATVTPSPTVSTTPTPTPTATATPTPTATATPTPTPIPTPAPSPELIYGLATGAQLVSFQSSTPGTIQSTVGITGLVAGQTAVAIDFRPATGALNLVSYNAITGAAQLYTVALATGVATPVGTGFTIATGQTSVSIDFNPVVDRIRLVTSGANNYRINPDTGAIAATDTNLAYAPGDSGGASIPNVTDVAYTNNFPGAGSTTLYGYGSSLERLVTVGSVNGTPVSPNTGQLFTVGASGVITSPAPVGFDISASTGIGYIAASASPALYTVNLATGQLTNRGQFGAAVQDLSVFIPTVTPLPANSFAATNLGAIPDNDCSGPGRQVMFAVTGISTPISNVRVSFTGTHTYVGDLDVRLIAPNGTTSAFIFTFVGNGAGPSGDSSDLNGTYNFFDAAVNNFTTAAGLVGPTTAIAPGNYRASDGTGANISLDSIFANTTPANGTYILQFNDCAAGDTGSITAATLSFNGPTPTPLPVGGFEGDVNRQVAGVPGTGDGDVNVGDQIMYQRFLSGLDCPTVSPNEQQRLDAGPRTTRGDALLGSIDGTAIDAYARKDSSTDFDPNTPGFQLTPAGGPTAITNLGCRPVSAPEGDNSTVTNPEVESASAERVVRIISGAAIDRDITVEIEMAAQGNEAGTQYGIHFDPAVVSISGISGVNSNPDITFGVDTPGGTSLNVNAEDAANGNIGIVENFNGASNSIEAIPAGSRRIAKITFHVLSGATPGESKVTFDESVVRGVSADTNGLILSTTYDQTGTITIPATAGASISGRVTTPDGRGLRNATVTIVDRAGMARTVTTSSFGYYKIDDLAIGASYTIGVASRQYRFAARTVAITDSLSDVDFTGQE